MEECAQPPLWDYDEDDQPPPQLNWERKVVATDKLKTFLIMEGASAVEFADRCLVNKKNVINRIVNANTTLYEIKEQSLVVCTSLCDDDTITSDVTDLLLPWIESATSVFAIKSVPFVYYKSTEDIEDTFLMRALHTEDSTKTPTDVPILEQPNILSGVSAGVINRRDYKNLPASIYAYYLQSNILGLDSLTARPIQDLLKKLNIHCTSEFTTKLKSLSNLYV
ncbi:proteasome assembly chaperone 1 [Arctopsyche grandis]|uniref:proteasome assembly chaperone 1 n=1 Tax=Arctopsyche grandis TaxID=121162 RepID=UPI00406D6995